MEYSKSINHVSVVCAFVSQCNICTLVATPEIHLQIYGTETIRAQNKFQALRTDRQQNVRLHHTQTYLASTLFAFHSSHLFQEYKIDLRLPLNNIRSTLWSSRTCSTAAQVSNLTTKIPKQTYHLSILLTVFISLSVTKKRLKSTKI
jgi:hypothetical protein